MTYDLWHQPPERERLAKLLGRVLDCMSDGTPRTYAEIQSVTGGSETGISARIRDFRKPRFQRTYPCTGVESKPMNGCWYYRMLGAPSR